MKCRTADKHATSWQSVLAFLWRLALAIVAGFVLVSLCTTTIPSLFSTWFGVNKANLFMWMMLFSFALYTKLILWIISSRNLPKTSTIVLILLAVFYGGLNLVPAADETNNITKEKSQ